LAGTTTVDSSIVADNTAAADGAGIYNTAVLYIQSGSVIGGAGVGNRAIANGGGIFNSSAGTSTAMTTVDDSIITANTAVNGGGIYNQDVLVVQNGATIGEFGGGNISTTNGGGIYNEDGTSTVTDSRILDNSAANGGGVYNNHNAASVVSVTYSCIVGNSATSFFNNQSPEQFARYNWWGDVGGPTAPGADTVGGNVDYADHLTVPPIGCAHDNFLPLVFR
jgi:hypothetical protein